MRNVAVSTHAAGGRSMTAAARRRGSARNDDMIEWLDQVLNATVMVLVGLIPVTYVLLLALRFVLFATGLVHYPNLEHFLLTGASGVLWGSALVVLLTAKGTLKKASEDGPRSVDVDDHFGTGLAVRAPFALLIAGLSGMPEGRAAHIVVGTFWGMAAAGSAVLHTVRVDKRSASRAGFFILLVEGLLAFFIFAGVLEGLNDHNVLVMTLEVGPAAVAACALTYLVICLGKWLARGRSRRA
jgi:hypothetical protein